MKKSQQVSGDSLDRSGDFSGMLARLNKEEYDKVLVRNLHSGDFWYDHESWSVSSGIRAAWHRLLGASAISMIR